MKMEITPDFTAFFVFQVLPNACRGVGMGLTITVFWILAFVLQSALEPLFAALTTTGVLKLFFYVSLCLLFIFTI